MRMLRLRGTSAVVESRPELGRTSARSSGQRCGHLCGASDEEWSGQCEALLALPGVVQMGRGKKGVPLERSRTEI